MGIGLLLDLIDRVELDKKYLFIVYGEGPQGKIGIEVLDYTSEEEVDGRWFDSIYEAGEFVSEFGR